MDKTKEERKKEGKILRMELGGGNLERGKAVLVFGGWCA
jgi:hypothetical protein